MQDDTNNDTLDMDEVKAALPSIGFIDMVGFDGCNMASIEVQMLWHGHATALSHSQEYVGWDGIEYDLVLAQLAANPNMTADSGCDRHQPKRDRMIRHGPLLRWMAASTH